MKRNTISCQSVRIELAEANPGPGSLPDWITSHLASCPECTLYAAQIKDLADALTGNSDMALAGMDDPNFKAVSSRAGRRIRKTRKVRLAFFAAAAVLLFSLGLPLTLSRLTPDETSRLVSRDNSRFVEDILDSPVLLNNTDDESAPLFTEDTDTRLDIDFSIYLE